MDAVIFDLDGVLVDSEQEWDRVRRSVVAEHGGTWTAAATSAQQGMSTAEWSSYLVTELGAKLSPTEIAKLVIERMAELYVGGPPLLPGAVAAVHAAAERAPVAIASSSPPRLIKAFLSATELTGTVRAAISSEQVATGKPAPDVYLLAARELGADPTASIGIEDSGNGIRAALAAGLTVYAVPNPHFPPDPAVLAQATKVLTTVADLPAALPTR